jgi:serine/threonine protein kinase/formylglycine-generating enzyme required for sulfatase activity/predicted esterase
MIPIAAGVRLGRYRIRSKLGAGGMGEVYLADDLELGRPVAIKVLPSADDADPTARKRLVREARAAATLDHQNICAVYEVGDADGHAFIAMQLVEGQTLDARLRQGPLDLADTLAIAVQIVDALCQAHEHGILHRDIKPANVMLTARGLAKVMDFGLAKLTSASGEPGNTLTASVVSEPGAVMGTVPYMSPEQVRGLDTDRRSDLFSVGVLLYEMVSGRRPFDDSSPAATASAILTRDPLPLARFAPDTPPELERIVAKSLRKDPEERYQTAGDLLVDLRALKEERTFQARLERSSPPSDRPAAVSATGVAPALRPRVPSAYVAAIVAVIVLVGGAWWWKQRADLARATAELPQLAALAEARRNFEAYDLAVALEPKLPGNATIAGLMPVISDTMSVTTDPPGARVYLKRFAPDAAGGLPERQLVGTTPLKNVRIARGEYVLSLELDGSAPYERSVSGVTIRQGTLVIAPPPIQVEARLQTAAAMPAGMVSVPGSDYRLASWSRPTDRRARLDDYYIDKFEVSNLEFKDFINAGGYVKREYWIHPFVKDGREVEWDKAMTLMVDRTGLPGPREWSNQNPPDGKADHPVTGVTWYEAAAYAAFRGKRLPTAFQWEKAARGGLGPAAGVTFMPWGAFYPGDTLAHRANFGTGTVPVASNEFGVSRVGAYNMAGNVSEWTMNDSSEGYLATGGSWGDPTYTFAQYGGRPGFFSSEKLGFRLAQNAPGATGDQGGSRIEIAQEIPTYLPTPVSTFNTLAAAYRYEPAPLDARIEETVDTPDWKREKITFNGAGGERAIAYLYLPPHAARPLHVIHYVPGGDVSGGFRPITESMDERMGPFVKLGRAAFGVVLKGYVGRLRPAGTEPAEPMSVEYLERVVDRMTDLRRGLDYLETRADVDRTRIGFLGPSSGAMIGLILAAIEPRYRAVVLSGSGIALEYTRVIAPANPVNFASHIRGPKLMVQGRYDEDSPLRTTAEPLFKLLAEPKQLYLYDGGHVPPLEIVMRATSGWLDEMMGRVAR